jgi:NADH-quinone oxidoreductase subunit N
MNLGFLAAIGAPFIPGGEELRPFIAELWLIGTIIAVLLTPFFTSRSNYACAAVALAGVALAFVSLLAVGDGATTVDSANKGMSVLVSDSFAVFWKLLLLLFVAGIILMWLGTTSSEMHEGDGPEFFALLLGATLGMSLMASASNLLMLFMAVEMASLPSYVLAGFRKTHRVGAEASLKYVLFGAATSAIMIYGLSMLYGLYGTMQISELAAAMMATGSGSGLLVVAIFGLIVGIGFKISAVPFHFWCPDVFEGASIEVSAFLSVASKGAALALLLRVLMLIAEPLGYHNVPGVSLTVIAVVLGVIGAITATVGNTAAFVQTNIKRLLAYSSIAHAGYMMCALAMVVKTSSAESSLNVSQAAAQAILMYLAVYLFMNLGAFSIAALVYRQTGSELISDYAGLGRRAPLLAGCMFLFMISLIGLPPVAGFAAKVNLLWILFQNGSWYWALIIIIGVNTIISAFYYFRVIRQMYLTDSKEPPFMANPLGAGVAVLSAVMLVVMFIGWNPLVKVTTDYSKIATIDQPAAVTAQADPQAIP